MEGDYALLEGGVGVLPRLASHRPLPQLSEYHLVLEGGKAGGGVGRGGSEASTASGGNTIR